MHGHEEEIAALKAEIESLKEDHYQEVKTNLILVANLQEEIVRGEAQIQELRLKQAHDAEDKETLRQAIRAENEARRRAETKLVEATQTGEERREAAARLVEQFDRKAKQWEERVRNAETVLDSYQGDPKPFAKALAQGKRWARLARDVAEVLAE